VTCDLTRFPTSDILPVLVDPDFNTLVGLIDTLISGGTQRGRQCSQGSNPMSAFQNRDRAGKLVGALDNHIAAVSPSFSEVYQSTHTTLIEALAPALVEPCYPPPPSNTRPRQPRLPFHLELSTF
jgi:hypothetical protein